MEKAIKNLSFIMIGLTITFFLTTFIGGNAQSLGLGAGISQLTITIANLTLYIVPILFTAIFFMGMSIMVRTIMAKQSRVVGSKYKEKVPMLHFIISIICFVLYYLFVSAVFSTAV